MERIVAELLRDLWWFGCDDAICKVLRRGVAEETKVKVAEGEEDEGRVTRITIRLCGRIEE